MTKIQKEKKKKIKIKIKLTKPSRNCLNKIEKDSKT